jgi:hypothetical protein
MTENLLVGLLSAALWVNVIQPAIRKAWDKLKEIQDNTNFLGE